MAEPYIFREEPVRRDIEAVSRLVAETGFFRADEVAVAAELVEERLDKGLASGYHFIFAENTDGGIGGYVCYGSIPCTVGSFDLYWIAVDKGSQGRGLGKTLIDRTEEAVRRLGGRNIYIETSGTAKYLPTQNFYRRCGYSEAARLPDFYEQGDDKIIFGKKL